MQMTGCLDTKKDLKNIGTSFKNSAELWCNMSQQFRTAVFPEEDSKGTGQHKSTFLK